MVTGRRSRQHDLAVAFGRVGQRAGDVDAEVFEPGAAVVGVLRRRLIQVEVLPHETPFHFVAEIAEVAHEARELDPAVGIDPGNLRPPHQQIHGRSTVLQRDRRVVEGRGARAEDCDPLAGQFRKVDRIGCVRVAFARQRRRNQLRHPPSARSFDAGGEHDLPGQEPVGFAAVLRLAHMHGENARGDRLDVEHLGAVSDRDADGVAHPQQIFVPEIARDLVELLPGLNAESLLRTRTAPTGSGCRGPVR